MVKYNNRSIILFCILLVISCTENSKGVEQVSNSTNRLDQKGKTGLMIFSGYYGFWLGVVPHLIWESTLIERNGKKMALGPLITTPTSLILTYYLTKNRPITRTHNSLITMGGHWGTWQGIGWTIAADKKKETVVATGAITGLLGIGGGIMLGSTDWFSEGGAALIHSSMFMGAWFGYVAGVLFDLKSNDLLTNMILTSDVFMSGTGFLFAKTNFKRSSVVRVNGLIYGNAAIAWLLYLIYTAENKKYDYDHKTAMAIAGAGSVLGIIGATTDIVSYSETRSIFRMATDIKIQPQFLRYSNTVNRNKIIPGIGLFLQF